MLKLDDIIEVDETCAGGKMHNPHIWARRENAAGKRPNASRSTYAKVPALAHG